MRMVKKIYLLWLIASCLVATASAQVSVKLCLELKDGSTFEYLLKQKPVVSFDAQNVHIETEDVKIELQKAYGDIKCFYFDTVSQGTSGGEDIPTEVEKPIAEPVKDTFSSYYDGHTMRLTDTQKLPPVLVYGLDGRRVETPMQRSNNEVLMQMDTLPTGVYVIKCGNHTFKIICR